MAGRTRSRLQAFIRKGLLTFIAAIAVAAVACGERARLTFEPSTDGLGPNTTIDEPQTADVEVPAGPDFSINGRSADRDGVDTVYFEVLGGNQSFQPFVPSEFRDTVRFSIPISTSGWSGDTILVFVYATDLLGTRGDTAVRRLLID